jgi:hypothetical protein
MTADLAVLGAGAFLVLVALIWKAYRVIDERLREIQANIAELHDGVTHLFLLASKSDAKPSKLEPFAFDTSKVTTDLALLRSPGLESELAQVDELCSKLITLVPPPEAVPLISGVTQAKSAPLISEVNAEKLPHFQGRRLLLAWPTIE